MKCILLIFSCVCFLSVMQTKAQSLVVEKPMANPLFTEIKGGGSTRNTFKVSIREGRVVSQATPLELSLVNTILEKDKPSLLFNKPISVSESYTIISVVGKKIAQGFGNGTNEIKIGSLISGVYFIQIQGVTLSFLVP